MNNLAYKKGELEGILVVFGGTGDLTKRKILPAIYNLYCEGFLSENFAMVSIGRRDKTTKAYREEASAYISEFSKNKISQSCLNEILKKISYFNLNFSIDFDSYNDLKGYLSELDKAYNTKDKRLFFLAVAPNFFDLIVEKLYNNKMIQNEKSWQRVLIEKPFGIDLKTARFLNENITKVLSEKHIFRIDHYLGKEMIQNILAIRFSNSLFEPLWNYKYIDNVQIVSTETLGVENRGNYYEGAGILRDMIQNHLLQLLSMIAMEPPINFEAESIRDEKVKVLKSLLLYDDETVQTNIIRGQYGRGTLNGKEVPAYREEQNVKENSETETFVACKLFINNFRWAHVPFYIKTGKRMPKKETKIIIEFKKLPGINFYKELGELVPNLLTIKVQPGQGISLEINTKTQGNDFSIGRAMLDYCHNCQIEKNSPEAYERILLEALKGNQTLFTRWDEVENSWKFIDRIKNKWESENPRFPNYDSGISEPKGADLLIKNDGRQWW